MIAWTRCPPGVERPPMATIRRPEGPRAPRCARSDGGRPPPPRIDRPSTLSIRPFRSTYTSSGPFTMTSVTSGSFSRNSMGPNPTTSSETSFTTSAQVALRQDVRPAPAGSTAPPRAPARAARCAAPREAARVHPLQQPLAEIATHVTPARRRRHAGPVASHDFAPRHRPSVRGEGTPAGRSEGEANGGLRWRRRRWGNATRVRATRTSPGRPISPSRPGDRSDNSKGTRCAVRLVQTAGTELEAGASA